MSGTFNNLSSSDQARFAAAIASKWSVVSGHCNIDPSDIISSAGPYPKDKSARFCEILNDLCVPLETVILALVNAGERDVLHKFKDTFNGASTPVVASSPNMATFADLRPSLCDSFASRLAGHWRTTAAHLEIRAADIEHSLPHGHSPVDCARALVQRMVDDQVTIERGLKAVTLAGNRALVNRYRPQFLRVEPKNPEPKPVVGTSTAPTAAPFLPQVDADRLIRSLEAATGWKQYPFVKFMVALVGDDFPNLVRNNRLFLQALSFAYRDVGNKVQLGLVTDRGSVDTEEMEALYEDVCLAPTTTIEHLVGAYDPRRDLVSAITTKAFRKIRDTMSRPDRAYYGSATNRDEILKWVEKDVQRRMPFLKFIRKARSETGKDYFPNCQPTFSELLSQFDPEEDETMAEAGTIETAVPLKKTADMTTAELKAVLEPAFSEWANVLFLQDIDGSLLPDLTQQDLQELAQTYPFEGNTKGSRMKLMRRIQELL